MLTNTIRLTITFLIGLAISAAALAKEVKIFTEGNIPSAEEMADILLNVPSKGSSIKTRSISFGVAKHAGDQASDIVSLGLPIKFALNSSQLNNASLAYLNQLGNMLNLENIANERIMVVGHTDASGEQSYNQLLSEKRAETVKSYLVANYQIDPARLQTTGKGETETLPGQPKNSAINRRVEFYRIK